MYDQVKTIKRHGRWMLPLLLFLALTIPVGAGLLPATPGAATLAQPADDFTWELVFEQEGLHFYTLAFPTADTGYALGGPDWWDGFGNGPSYIVKTTDGGKDWTRVIGDEDFAKSAPPGYVHCIFVNLHPDTPDWVYAGTVAHGLWTSPDAGKTWTRFQQIPFRACHNVAFDPEDRTVMYVTTFGGGVWKGHYEP